MNNEDGFLSRWSRRKVTAREGAPLAEPPVPVPAPDLAARPPVAVPQAAAVETSEPAASPPTLDDVAALTPESDYTRFVARGVDPGVKNAALKKLFTDPHFNVMDGLDIYIDDYGKPDPLPPGMLEQMFQSRALGLFPEPEPEPKPDPPVPVAPVAPAETLHESPAPAALPTPEPAPATDEDTDLRLQPDDAAGLAGADAGAGEDARRQH